MGNYILIMVLRRAIIKNKVQVESVFADYVLLNILREILI